MWRPCQGAARLYIRSLDHGALAVRHTPFWQTYSRSTSAGAQVRINAQVLGARAERPTRSEDIRFQGQWSHEPWSNFLLRGLSRYYRALIQVLQAV